MVKETPLLERVTGFFVCYVELSIFDLRGLLIVTIVDEVLNSGYHERTWNGHDKNGRSVSSSMYFARINIGGNVMGQRLVLTK